MSLGQGDWESIGDREACVAQTLLCRRPRTVAGVTIQEHAPLAYDKHAFFIMWEGPVGKVTEADDMDAGAVVPMMAERMEATRFLQRGSIMEL